ncbi:MAG: 23S rRNA (adenine(2503)-C(2))-methyltransferase RlmN [Planctomycetota bacterium]|nr:23S rRNA (adenine(2503)-C(2))-methyltransferase RlmN [Planctomycetota bacterium]MDI6786995.1 23S rRNA (adenine(2503)-C(2))-methyltransferase RlmN [Planctomycetota bacterium]
MRFIKDLSFEELVFWIKEQNESPYRASQIFAWLYQKFVDDFDTMTDLSSSLRRKLKSQFELSPLELKKKLVSALDNTEKYLFALKQDDTIESVVMPYERRCTICISSQVGCRFHCVFCASGKKGFIRNLSSGEIIEQIVIARQQGHKITHIVFMGMGEPLDNLNNVIKIIKLLNNPNGFNIGARRITISTCGIPESIAKLADLDLQIELSVSLHSARDELRSRLMPINRKYPLSVLLKTIKEYISRTNRQITFEYTLIKDNNSSDKDAVSLAKLLKGLNCKVNLIPFNISPLSKRIVEPATREDMITFQSVLKSHGIKSTLRNSRGADIQGACGQLSLTTI